MAETLLLDSILDTYPSSFFVVKPIIKEDSCNDFTYMYANPAFGLLIGKNIKELIGHTFREVFGEEGEAFWLKLFYDAATKKLVRYVESNTSVLKRHLSVETFYIEKDMCGCVIRDYNSIMEDYAVCYNQSLQNKAYTDALTGAYNRFHLQENESSFSEKNGIGIAYFDLNNLKRTNDTYGHSAGDELLCEFAHMLTVYYNNSLVYRLGGDEFLVITHEMSEKTFTDSCTSLKHALDTSGNAAIGFKFYNCASNIWDNINECDKLMYQHKFEMKKSR